MDLKSRFAGCMAGLALGDALGAPFEGIARPEDSEIREFLKNPPSTLRYTDDTEMAIGVAESLAFRGGLDREDMARRFVKNFRASRGYGPGTIRVLSFIEKGIPWDRANRMVFPDGSFGNGAAMRAAPLGLFFFRDMNRVREATYSASAITHDHPQAKEGAFIIAFSVAAVLNAMGREELMDTLMDSIELPEYKRKLDAVRSLLGSEASPGETAEMLGNTVEAVESVPAALYAFLRYGDDFAGIVSFCISLGGDTDTISAMAGSLSGTSAGIEGLPRNLLTGLEDGKRLAHLASELYHRAV